MVIGVIIGIISSNGWANVILHGALGFIIGTIGGALIAMIVGYTGHLIYPEKITEKVFNVRYLEVLQDNSSVNGSFFLGCGTINNEMCYSFYEKVDIDEFKMDMIRYNEATVKIIRDDSKPRIENIHKEWRTNWGVWDDYYNVIYVPDGTIKNSFTLDAK